MMKIENVKVTKTFRGILCTLMGAVSWGFSGACGQYLFLNYQTDIKWLTAVRMISAGIVLLLLGFYKGKHKMLGILKQPKDMVSLLIFSLFGLLFCQYAYLTAISYSNAGTATVLQYTAPVLIMLLVCVKARKLPNAKEGLAVILALLGTFVLATHGNVSTMILTKQGLIWGLMASIGLVCYTLMPAGIVKKWGSITVTGYAMCIGGIALALLSKVWNIKVVLDIPSIAAVIAICLVGTVLAFTLYMQGVKDIGPVKASMLASIEPVSAALLAAFWLHSQLIWIDVIGFVCILTTVFLLSKNPDKALEENPKSFKKFY